MLVSGPAACAVVALAALTIAGCGGTSASTPTVAPSSTPSALSGSLVVFAAASLTEAFKDAETTLETHFSGFSATYSFAGSQQLVTNLEGGAPVDVIATADMSTMQTLVGKGLVETPRTFARNRLEIAVAKGNPRSIHSLADLANPSISVVLAAPAVPAGKFALQALQKAGVTVTPKSLELDVKSTLEKVESGDADAAIVYTTDVMSASSRVDGVVIPESDNVVALYPIAVVTASTHQAAAAAFVQQAVSGLVEAALQKRGFLSP